LHVAVYRRTESPEHCGHAPTAAVGASAVLRSVRLRPRRPPRRERVRLSEESWQSSPATADRISPCPLPAGVAVPGRLHACRIDGSARPIHEAQSFCPCLRHRGTVILHQLSKAMRPASCVAHNPKMDWLALDSRPADG